MLRAWYWRGSYLQRGQEVRLAPHLASILLTLGVAERLAETATIDPPMTKRKPKGRKRAVGR